ncbi:MAG: VOC family protein [Chloroflexi bacterium]|nr:VOC family protein [Chloroflexota bacterium]
MRFQPGEINIVCSDIGTSLHFYRDILGFEAEQDEWGFTHLRAGAFQYVLLPTAEETPPVQPYGVIPQLSMGLYVTDLAEAAAYFKEHGVSFAEDLEEGGEMFVIRDPDGLPWEVTV